MMQDCYQIYLMKEAGMIAFAITLALSHAWRDVRLYSAFTLGCATAYNLL